ncbi:MAG: hypothetical protein KKC55_17480, partial [Gammaproteobacteria bacterium]|nr:hypothetical protein [Gammaproteobacteria bacterium]
MPDEKPKKDKKDEEPEKKKEMVYPEGGIDGMIIRDGAPADVTYPLPEPSGIIITDQIDTAR